MPLYLGEQTIIHNGISYAPNIAQKTNQGITGWSWGNAYGGVIREEVVEDGIRCVKMTRDSTENTGWSYIFYSEIGRQYYKPNTVYTISFEVKSNVSSPFSQISLLTPSATESMMKSRKFISNIIEANVWNKVVGQITTKDVLPENTSQGVYIRCNKLFFRHIIHI